jgi:hypothetical protein
MTEAEFRSRRRQKYLTAKYFELNKKLEAALIEAGREGIKRAEADGAWDSSSHGGIFKDRFKLVLLHYTAGEAIESLGPLYSQAMHWFREWHLAEERASLNRTGFRGGQLS